MKTEKRWTTSVLAGRLFQRSLHIQPSTDLHRDASPETMASSGNTPYHGVAIKPQDQVRSYSQQVSDDRGSGNEQWSGDDSDGDGEGADDGSRKRKRPMSVSCELCKARKVKC